MSRGSRTPTAPPVQGTTVTFERLSATGATPLNAAVTSADGYASISRTETSAGVITYRAHADVAGTTYESNDLAVEIISLTLTLTRPGPTSVPAGERFNLEARLVDSDGNGIPGVRVTFERVTLTGTEFVDAGLTSADGDTFVTTVETSPGAVTYIAHVEWPGVTATSNELTVTITGATPTLTLHGPQQSRLESTLHPRRHVQQRRWHPHRRSTRHLHLGAAGKPKHPLRLHRRQGSRLDQVPALGGAGQLHCVASATVGGSTYYSNAGFVTLSSTPQLELTGSPRAQAGKLFNLTATLTDGSGTPLHDASVVFTREPQGGTLSSRSAPPRPMRMATPLSWTENSPGWVTYRAYTVTNDTTQTSDELWVDVAAPSSISLTLSGPAHGIVNQPLTITATVTNGNGDPAAGLYLVILMRVAGGGYEPYDSGSSDSTLLARALLVDTDRSRRSDAPGYSCGRR